MTDLQVRRPKFNFTEDVPWGWNPQNPGFSFFMNATSIIAICFEQMIVAAVQEAKPLIKNPDIDAESTAFLRQEAHHSSSHRKHVSALIKHYPGLQETFDEAVASYEEITATESLEYRLAYVADLEATFTPSFKIMLDNDDILFRPGDDRVASLFLWHFVEEVEHRSSALIIYDEVVGRPWYRLRVLPRVVKHLLEILEIIADGVNKHVPLADRKVDARTLLPVFGMRQSLRQKLPFLKSDPNPGPAAFSGVPMKEKLLAGANVLMSQTPYHKPENTRLPEFAQVWFDRWDEGCDITHWYTAELAK